MPSKGPEHAAHVPCYCPKCEKSREIIEYHEGRQRRQARSDYALSIGFGYAAVPAAIWMAVDNGLVKTDPRLAISSLMIAFSFGFWRGWKSKAP